MLLSVHFVASMTALESAHTLLPFPAAEKSKAVPSSKLQAAFLNYNTLAADLVWIDTITNHSALRGVGQSNEHILDLGNLIADLDSEFRRPYLWVPAAILNNRKISAEELEAVTVYMERGIEAHPSDFEIPYVAALNYIGYSYDRTQEERRMEFQRAIGLAEVAVARPGAHELALGIREWFRGRLRRLQGKPDDASQEKDHLLRMYTSMFQPAVRRSLEIRLDLAGCPKPCRDTFQTEINQSLRDLQFQQGLLYTSYPLWLLIKS